MSEVFEEIKAAPVAAVATLTIGLFFVWQLVEHLAA